VSSTPALLAEGHQERQLIAGRYRLVSFHRGDDTSEVWRALDESTNLAVTLEFLRDRGPESRERFLAGARRLAAAPQPAVMRVASIHDDAEGTFIVFEHLVAVPTPTDWVVPKLEPAPAVEPATALQSSPAIVESAPPTEPANANAEATAAGATSITPTEAAPLDATAVADERPTDRGLSLLLFAIRTRELSLIDTLLLTDSAFELMAITQAELKAIRFDPTVLTDMRDALGRINPALVVSAVAGLGGAARRVVTFRPRVHRLAPHVSRPPKAPKMKAVAMPKPPKPAKLPKAPKLAEFKPAKEAKAPRVSRGLGLRIRWGRVLTRGLSLGVLAAILVAAPAELIANVGIYANDLSVAIREKLATVVPASSGLQRASFELPPLAAYAATFDRQAPYPTAKAGGTVEWVVALRNTGSVGWYRGIDGAQASLALADGTSAGVQTTEYVGPGQIGWFVVHFPAPAQPGTAKIKLVPRIDGRGALPDIGIYATVTVSPNP
jgi:hypothetical protein